MEREKIIREKKGKRCRCGGIERRERREEDMCGSLVAGVFENTESR